MPDILSQEGPLIDFLTDTRISSTGLVDLEHCSSSAPNNFTESVNREHAALLAINKSWFNYFGRTGGSGDMPSYANIQDVPPRLRLIRVLPNWENMNNTLIEDRKWNGTVYISSNAYASDSAIAVLQPTTGKLFVDFLKSTGQISLPKGKIVKRISATDDYFMETVDAKNDFIITTNNRLKATDSVVLDKCYIVSF